MGVFGSGPFDLDITHGDNGHYFDTFHLSTIDPSQIKSPFQFLGTSGNDRIGSKLPIKTHKYMVKEEKNFDGGEHPESEQRNLFGEI